MVLLLDNISTSTSIWFLLSNNHMNSIITHKFDFAQEEVLAYYISFMRSLSMKLTNDTILFFHNEHLPEFPLYAEVSWSVNCGVYSGIAIIADGTHTSQPAPVSTLGFSPLRSHAALPRAAVAVH